MTNIISPRVRQLIVKLLTNRWALGCFAFVGLQQILESSATFWLVTLTERITTGGDYFPILLVYLLTLLLPYIPGCIGQIFKASWKQEAQRSFVNTFVASHKDNIVEWGNRGRKEEKLSILTAEAPTTLHTFIDYAWELYTYVVNVTCNIIVLSLVVEPLFAVSYGFSLTCVFLIMRAKRRSQRQLTQKAIIARVDLTQSLLAAWDNVLVGNKYNFKLWNEKTSQRLKRCLQRNIDLERFDQVLAISVALITSVPSIAVVLYSMTKYQGDVVKLASFAVILPMLYLLLSYTYQTLSLVFRWGMHRSKLITIYRSIEPVIDSPTKMEKKIKWPKLMATFSTKAPDDHISVMTPKAFLSQEDLVVQAMEKGRLTIRGENGSGKSTALMLVKNHFANRAFLLPTHSQLSFVSEGNKYSTGEALHNRLVEILEKVDVDVLLLDEWDANLDEDNRARLSVLIDELSQKKCVIEVRHR